MRYGLVDPETHFASAERADAETVAGVFRELSEHPLIWQLMDSFPEPALVLNRQRQVVFANDKLCAALNRQVSEVIGMRPGELFRCVHADEEVAGCGTSRFCAQCGAAQAVVKSVATNSSCVAECRLMCISETGQRAMDLRVSASPLECGGQYTVFAIRDITDQKRREVLERLFFHDVLNAAGGLRGLMEVWKDLPEEETTEMSAMAAQLANQLVQEIRAYRDLVAAERGDLAVVLKHFDVAPILLQTSALYRSHNAAAGKRLPVPEIAGPTAVYSDAVLLSRVVGNLLKNALEAAAAGTAVRLGFDGDGLPTVWVHNEACMPENVQLQIFQRSFSTKSETGRGLGTYSAKLLTEQYLKGTVSFTSTKEAGTTFRVTLAQPPLEGLGGPSV